MIAGVAATDAVVAVDVDILLEVLVGLHESLRVFGSILEVDVVVGKSVTDEQRTMEFLSSRYGVHLVVASLVLFRCAHVTLGIDGVVVAPAGGRCHCHASTEHRSSLAHAHESVPSAVAPSPHAYAVFIDVGLTAEPQGCLHLVECFFLAETQVSTLLEVGSASACTAVIYTHHYIPFLRHILFEQRSLSGRTYPPRVEHLLAAWTAILVHDDGIASRGVEAGRLHHPSVELHSF